MSGIERLLDIMRRLRDPIGGCPWDREQTFRTIAPYTIEEAYEVADAIDRADTDALRDELGDLLLQVVFHAQMAEEQGAFAFDDVVSSICDKMERRHPHVFGDEIVTDTTAQAARWEQLKAQERAARGEDDDRSAIAGIARGLPEWKRAVKLQHAAAKVGFDWPGPEPVLDKLSEEIEELRAEFACNPRDAERLEDELGDVLFVAANLTRHAGADFGAALRRANAKFERRFRAMERFAAEDGVALSTLSLDAQDRYWDRAKRELG
jgi:nucleoside triphosphate diphosphatase